MTTFLFIAGAAAAVVGVAMIYVPAAVIAGGLGVCAAAAAVEANS